MKQKLILFFIGSLFFSIGVQSQDEVKLTSIAEIKAVFENSDVVFYPEIINEPTNALKYKGDATVEEVFNMLQKALDDSERNLSQKDKHEFFAYHAFGNYIEKLYLISTIIERPKKDRCPCRSRSNLKKKFNTIHRKSGYSLTRFNGFVGSLSKFVFRCCGIG